MAKTKHKKEQDDSSSTKLKHKALKVRAEAKLHQVPQHTGKPALADAADAAEHAVGRAHKQARKEAKQKAEHEQQQRGKQQQKQQQKISKHGPAGATAEQADRLATKLTGNGTQQQQQQQHGVSLVQSSDANSKAARKAAKQAKQETQQLQQQEEQQGKQATTDAASKAARKAAKQAQKEAQQRQQKEQERQAKVLRLIKKIAKASEPDKKARLQRMLQRALQKAGEQAQEEDGEEPVALAAAAAAPPPAASRPKFTFTRTTTPSSSSVISAASLQPLTAEERAARALRQRRFADDVAALAAAGDGSSSKGVRLVEAVRQGQYGTLEALEKEYLRLTTLPLAADVRPPEVLRQALALVKARWAQQPDYQYAWKQLKSIRQDLTVQGVAGALAVDVYETHGRIALEVDDQAEFRQCLSVLRRLYDDGAPAANAAEFVAYGILFAARHGSMLLVSELAKVPEQLLGSGPVAFALEACSAMRMGDYAAFVQLYERAPFMCAYLLDALLLGVQQRGLATLVAAYSPLPLPLEFVAMQLGFEGPTEAAAFAESQGAVVDAARQLLDTKLSKARATGPARPL